ncbi:MAG: DUF262 domain-containing protein [Desulfurobacteriaceae bacterium]
MGVEYKKYELEKFFDLIDSGKIVLPEFQRGYVWSIGKQKRFLASILVGLPVGSTLHIEGSAGDFVARAICERREVNPKEECEYLLDGQQRISTLYNIFQDIYEKEETRDWKKVLNSLFDKLRYRWFIKLSKEDDIFGLKTLKFDPSKLLTLEPRRVEEYIEVKKIEDIKEEKIQKKNAWYHPAFIPIKDGRKLTGRLSELEKARLAAEEYLVPLFEIRKKELGLHRQVLKQIAKRRVEELQAEVADGKLKLRDILSDIHPDIDNLDERTINEVWTELQISWVEDVSRYLEGLLKREIPVVLLHKNEIGRAAVIFEEFNTGGTKLEDFDLFVAKAARVDSERSLVRRIMNVLDRSFDTTHLENEAINWKANLFTPTKELSKKFKKIFLNSLSLIVFSLEKGEELSKEMTLSGKILSLQPEDVVKYTERVTEAIVKAFAFLQLKCGHVNEKSISYEYMILPIVYVFYCKDDIWYDNSILNKIGAWFWGSLFAGMYKERQDDQLIKDIKMLKAWLVDGEEDSEEFRRWKTVVTDKIFNREGYSDWETLLNKNPETEAPKAIKKAILNYILSKKPVDFLPDQEINLTAYKCANGNFKLEEHHIIPLASATKIGESTKKIRKEKKHILNSPLNLTYISDSANLRIRDKRIDEYFNELGHFKIGTHIFPTDIRKPQNDEERKEILKKRLELLKQSVTSEINMLLNS